MRYLSVFLTGLLVVGGVSVARAQSVSCFSTSFAADDGVHDLTPGWVVGEVNSGAPHPSAGCSGTSPGGGASPFSDCATLRDIAKENCTNRYNNEVKQHDPQLLKDLKECNPEDLDILDQNEENWSCQGKVMADFWKKIADLGIKESLKECRERADGDYIRCAWPRSARLPQKTCRPTAKHGKQARAGFNKTQRGCSSKAPSKGSKPKVKGTKTVKAKVTRR